MPQVQIDFAIARQRPAELIEVGNRRAGHGQADHDRAAQDTGQRRTQARQQRPETTEQRRRKQQDPLHEQRGQRQAYPVETWLHRLGQHQHQYQQFGEQHHAQQGFRLAQFRDEELVAERRCIFIVQPLNMHRRSFRVARQSGKRASSGRAK
ncbi:hypothetical protein D9M68_750990 [compost metagenome]